MIASLMMYARPELSDALDRFWALIRTQLAHAGIDTPATLSQSADPIAVWTDPDLLLSQTCGMPYRLWLHDRVQLVGTPDYGLPDCPAGHYRSAIIVRASDPRASLADFADTTLAYNDRHSQSGFAAPYWHLAPAGHWPTKLLHTGAHLNSARAVAEGPADIAAIDAVTWRNLQTYEPFAKTLRVLDWTVPTPGLPLITGPNQNASAIRAAVVQALEQLSPKGRASLGMTGITHLPKSAYLAVPTPPDITSPHATSD